jgi:hypothetical protein
MPLVGDTLSQLPVELGVTLLMVIWSDPFAFVILMVAVAADPPWVALKLTGFVSETTLTFVLAAGVKTTPRVVEPAVVEKVTLQEYCCPAVNPLELTVTLTALLVCPLEVLVCSQLQPLDGMETV